MSNRAAITAVSPLIKKQKSMYLFTAAGFAVILGFAAYAGNVRVADHSQQATTGLSTQVYNIYKNETKRQGYNMVTFHDEHNKLQFLPRYVRYCHFKLYGETFRFLGPDQFPIEPDLEEHWQDDLARGQLDPRLPEQIRRRVEATFFHKRDNMPVVSTTTTTNNNANTASI